MLKLSDRELERLALRVEEDYRGAIPGHQRRMERFRDAYRRWRVRVEAPPAGEEHRPNLQVPLVQWNTFGKWAKMLQSLLGEDAEVIAQPTGPSDQRNVHKVGRFMTWAALQGVRRAVTRYGLFTFRSVLFGVSHAYRPWCRETDGEGTVVYEGVDFRPLWPDDLIVPAEDAETIQDFSYVIRKFRLTPDDLLRGEADGRYTGIRKNFEKIARAAQNGGAEQRETEQPGDEVKREKDESEGVTYDGYQSAGELLTVFEWYGRWRMPKGKDAGDDPFKGREMQRTDLVVYFIPSIRLVVGVDKLAERYPRMENKRPFAETHLVKDGSYWGLGASEMLCDMEDETSSTRNLSTEAMKFGVAPVVFFEPASGYKPAQMPIGPGMAIPVASTNGIHVVQMRADLSGPVAAEQGILGYAERVFGVSDQALGRAIDRPNAPRTAAGQMLLAEQGDVRVWLDVAFLRDDFAEIFRDMWEMWSEFGAEGTFFRVTEEDARGLFDVRAGGAQMTATEFGGRYDFTIKFATSVWSREAQKERQIQMYQADLQNPLIAANPRALWLVTQHFHKAMGDSNFADLIPEPPDLDMPKSPREEWALLQQGEDVFVNPADNDDLHLIDHYRRVQEEQDPAARAAGIAHIADHEKQKRTKLLMRALASEVAKSPGVAQMALGAIQQQPDGGGMDPAMGGGANALGA